MRRRTLVIVLVLLAALLGGGYWLITHERAELPITATEGPNPRLTDPNATLIPTINIARARAWKGGEQPMAAPGLAVGAFARGLAHPRWLAVLPNGDVLVAETDAPPKPDDSKGLRGTIQRWVMSVAGSGRHPSANRISLLRDTDGDGIADARSVLVAGLHSPVGMAFVGGQLYVAETDKLTRFPFTPGQTKIVAAGEKVTDLPAGTINHHWVKNVIASADGTRLYVSVGSNSNVGDNGIAAEHERAAIWEVDPATGQHRLFATGLRNPNGMAIEPATKSLWAVANERDEIGSDLVPDYLTSVDLGDDFGWPCFYWGDHADTRAPGCEVEDGQYVRRPDYAVGAHTASLGLAFATGAQLGPRFASGAFIGQHGSWNRRPKSGYRVIFVPFVNGKPNGMPIDVLTGFLSRNESVAHGRPVGVAIATDGALLVADDVGGAVWRVTAGESGAISRTAAQGPQKP